MTIESEAIPYSEALKKPAKTRPGEKEQDLTPKIVEAITPIVMAKFGLVPVFGHLPGLAIPNSLGVTPDLLVRTRLGPDEKSDSKIPLEIVPLAPAAISAVDATQPVLIREMETTAEHEALALFVREVEEDKTLSSKEKAEWIQRGKRAQKTKYQEQKPEEEDEEAA